MSQAPVRPGVGDKVKVVGGDTRKGQEGTIYKDDGTSLPYMIEFSDGKSEDWFEEADVKLLKTGKESKVSIWRSEAWMFMTPACNAVLSWNTIILLVLFLPFLIYTNVRERYAFARI
jgi:hypothetical protein